MLNSKRFFDNLSRLYAIYVTLLNGLRMKGKYMKMTKIWKLQSLIDFYLHEYNYFNFIYFFGLLK